MSSVRSRRHCGARIEKNAFTAGRRLLWLAAAAAIGFGGLSCSSSNPVAPEETPAGVITTWAGTGVAGWDGDAHFLLKSNLYFPVDLTFTPTGECYLLDWNNHRVRHLEDDGTLLTVIGALGVGDGPLDGFDFPPGAPGTTVLLNHPTHIIQLPDGTYLLTAWHNHKLRIYDPATGIVKIVAGERAGYGGDGGPAKDAHLNQPTQSVIGPDGNLYVLDQRNHRVRRIDLEGGSDVANATIHTVVGTGEPGYSGDGGPPLEAQLEFPSGTNPPPGGALVFDSLGRLYISDTINNAVRRVDFDLDLIETVAGTGTAGYGGDGGPATSASLNNPRDLDIGPDGRLYIADQLNNRVRAVDPSTGIITTVAGTGEPAFGGDGGPAPEAKLNWPTGLEFDIDGNLYIADMQNNRIRKIDFSADPVIPTVPTSPASLSAVAQSDAAIALTWSDDSDDELGFRIYREEQTAKADSLIAVVEAERTSYTDEGLSEQTTYAYRVYSYNLVGESEAAAYDTATTFAREVPPPAPPEDLVVVPLSSSEIRLTWTDRADNEAGYRIYRGATAETIDELVATLPADTETHDDGGLSDSTTYHYRVAAFTSGGESSESPTGSATTFGLTGDLPPIAPSGLTATAVSYEAIDLAWVDESDDEDGFQIYRGLSASTVDQLAGSVGAGVTTFRDEGLQELTTYYYRVHAFNGNGASPGFASGSAVTEEQPPYSLIETFMGTGAAGLGSDGLPPPETQLYLPMDVEFGPDGRPYVVDWNNHRVRTVIGGVVSTAVGTGQLGDAPEGPATSSSLNHPTNVSFDDTHLYLAAWHNSKVMKVDLATSMMVRICGNGQRAYGGDGGPAIDAILDLPSGTAVGPSGRVFIADQANQRVRMIDTDGIITTYAGTGIAGYGGDGGPATAAQFNFPGTPQDQSAQPAGRITLDDEGNLYVADTRNQRIRMVDPQGNIHTVAGNGLRNYAGDGGPAVNASLKDPRDVAIGPEGNLFIADTENNVIRRVDRMTGIITTVAGTGGQAGSSGDGGHPLEAKLWLPWGIGFDPDGNLYIADTVNNKIRIVYR